MSFDLNEEFGVDPNKEAEGVKVPLTDGDDAYVVIARASDDNPRYARALKRIPYKDRVVLQNAGQAMRSTDKVKKLWNKLIAEAILLDWKGLVINGKEVSYSTDNAEKVFHKYPDFRNFVWDIATSREAFVPDPVEEDREGNSKSASDGN